MILCSDMSSNAVKGGEEISSPSFLTYLGPKSRIPRVPSSSLNKIRHVRSPMSTTKQNVFNNEQDRGA